MSTILFNFIVINFSLTILYLVYKLFFSRDTFLILKRYFLKYSILFATIIPLIDISEFIKPNEDFREFVSGQSYLLPELTVAPSENPILNITQIFTIIYLVISLFLFIRFLLGLIEIIRIRIKGLPNQIQGYKVFVLKKEIAPFSFINMIFVNPELHSENELGQILSHEQTHVEQKHTVDVIVSEFLTILFWINPFAWLLKKEIRENLEYIADNNVLGAGIDTKNYQYHLLKLSYQSPELRLSNKFNISPLKKRIKMMNREKSKKVSAAKYLLVIPLAFCLILLANLQAVAASFQSMTSNEELLRVDNIQTETIEQIQGAESQKIQPETVAKKKQEKQVAESQKINELTVVGYSPNGNVNPAPQEQGVKDDRTVFMVVEKMPEFPGGQGELMKFLSQTVRYPVKAQELGKQGRVIVTFIVNEDGSIDDDIKVIRSVDTALDNEAIRVIKAMPKWTPGTQRGKAVRVNYTLPINFKLQGGENASKPLVLIDGVEQPADFDFNTIDSGTVESINVLKDETATEAYGEKGKNGVIVIKLKK